MESENPMRKLKNLIALATLLASFCVLSRPPTELCEMEKWIRAEPIRSGRREIYFSINARARNCFSFENFISFFSRMKFNKFKGLEQYKKVEITRSTSRR